MDFDESEYDDFDDKAERSEENFGGSFNAKDKALQKMEKAELRD